MNCKYCGTQSCDCKEIIQAHVTKITERFGRIRTAVANLDSQDLLRKEVRNCSGVARLKVFMCRQ